MTVQQMLESSMTPWAANLGMKVGIRNYFRHMERDHAWADQGFIALVADLARVSILIYVVDERGDYRHRL